MNKSEKFQYHLYSIGMIAFGIAMLAKSIYKLLGYGTPPHPATMVVYAVGVVFWVIGIPYIIYRRYFKGKAS